EVQRLVEYYNRGLFPAITSKGSERASGDLAPLADLALTLTGEGDFLTPEGERQAANRVLDQENLEPLTLLEKEGLSLINGTQVSTALAITAYAKAKNLLDSMTLIGGFSTEVMLGTDAAFRPEIQEARNQKGQKHAAAMLHRVMQDSGFRHSHETCDRVQDFYSLRCIPQVHGSAYDLLDYSAATIEREINSATDNPLTLTESGELVSGGNFHAAPIGHLMDYLAIVIADLGNMSERRIAAFQESSQSQAPMFLVKTPGLNSGFMIAHVTAASLASENKILAHPATVDSIPTSANQEDHVSMAPNAGRKLLQIIENTEWICGIEYLCCAQAADFHKDLQLGPISKQFYSRLRETVPFMETDSILHQHIESGARLIREGVLNEIWEHEKG
ncbi:MAG: aromatic amino acid lyase, partial [Lentisphaeria bacterium]|nr:aromatic amino acid lyase [Lentisphaeria bacterium]